MALQVFMFLPVVCLFLASFEARARFPGSLFGLPPHEEQPSAAGSTVFSSPALQMLALPAVSPPLPREVEVQLLYAPGARSKAAQGHPSA
jgi:hypothetical protein